MSGGFFRGTSAEQDTRFSNKQAKLLKTQKFAPELEHLVDITKVKMDVVKPWIAKRATELLGFEDELLINFIYGLLEGKEINGKQVQIQLTGFMEKHTGKFMKELWTLLISAQNNATGIPQQFLDAKEEETRKRKEESDRVLSEIQKRKETENRDFEQEKVNNMDGGAVNNNALEQKSFGAHSGDEKETDARNGFRAKNRYSKSPHSDGLSVSPRRDRPSGSISKSYSNSRSYSQERKISRSISGSPRSRKRSSSSERMSRSPRRSITPRGKCSRGSQSPVRKSSHSRRGSISRSQYRSPSPIRRRVRSPYYRGSPSPSPARRRSPSRLQHRSRSPLRRRSPSIGRHRSPSLRRRHSPSMRRRYSPSPRRRYSPSPRRRYSPSPRRCYSPSPRRRYSPSPRRRRSPYPRRRRSPSPRRHRSPSPRRHRSPSPLRRPPSPRRRPSPPIHRRRARSPSTSRSSSPIQRRSHGAVRRRSPSLVVRRSMSPVHQRSRSQMSSSLSPIHGRSSSPQEHASLSPAGHRSASLDQRSSASPDRQGSLSRAQHKLHSPRGSMSPVHIRRRSLTPQGRSALLGSWRSQSPPSSGKKATNLQRSASQREKARKHDKKAALAIEGEKVQYSAGRPPISLSPQRDEKGRNNLSKKVASSPSLKKLSSYSESPPQPRNRSPREDRSVSPAYSLREYKARDGSSKVEVEHGESKLVREPEEYKYKLSKKTSVKSSAELQKDSPDRSGSHCLYDTADLEMKDKGLLRTDRNGSKVNKGKNYLKDAGDGNMLSKSETSVWSKKNDGRKSPKDDYSGSEESDKPRVGGAEKRRHRRSSRRNTETDKSSDDSQYERREAKRRRKEEKKLRKEERHQRREERRRRKEEKRASKRKRKSKDSDSLSSDSRKHHDAYDSVGKMVVRRECHSSENEETESEKKRIEIELRERALQSLREKKGISR